MELLQIVKAIKGKQTQAPRHLYQLSYKRLYAVALRYVLYDDLAKDVLQNTYLKIFKGIPQLKLIDENSTLAWMKRICANEALLILRKNKSWSKRKLSNSSQSTTEDHCLLKDDIDKVLFELSEKQRLVFNLFAVEGYSHKEIAQSMNISETNSRTLYGRARKFLSNHPTLKMMYETAG